MYSIQNKSYNINQNTKNNENEKSNNSDYFDSDENKYIFNKKRKRSHEILLYNN